MLTITIPKGEMFNSTTNEFISVKGQTIVLEHSLVSLSKWEAKYHKPWMTKFPETYQEFIDYVRFMTLTQNVDPMVYNFLTKSNLEDITNYIREPMTATTISEHGGKRSHQIVTAEVIYYWMISFGIPVEFQKWHLNRLMTLIRVCSEMNSPSKKMGPQDLAMRNRSLNAARKAALHTKG